MKSARFFLLIFVLVFLIFLPQSTFAKRSDFENKIREISFIFNQNFHFQFDQFIENKHFDSKKYGIISSNIVETPTNGGIKEIIPKKYLERYNKWKTEFLSTELGRGQWENYANNKQFILKIKVSSDKKQGAKTDDYLWNEAGDFVGATITLGNKLEKGFPEATYYPVMNSLSSDGKSYSINENILAATKFAHEIGHVNQTFKENRDKFLLQHKLSVKYIDIFLSNGHNASDENLIELAEKMGGTPMKIWENREYWSEVNALVFLNERISKEVFYCRVFSKINRNIEDFAKNYEDRFAAAIGANSIDTVCRK